MPVVVVVAVVAAVAVLLVLVAGLRVDCQEWWCTLKLRKNNLAAQLMSKPTI
jgi:hypothetical protein